METLIILAQSKTGAAIEIIIFLVVAALIGYLTSYFYYKPIYLKKIHALEKEISDLKKEIDRMKDQIADLEHKIVQKDQEIDELKKKKKKEE